MMFYGDGLLARQVGHDRDYPSHEKKGVKLGNGMERERSTKRQEGGVRRKTHPGRSGNMTDCAMNVASEAIVATLH
jgi:hypothetical protein